ncbi:MAG: hypothetical protein WCW40_11455, partial [Bacteroidota bacterium]
MKRFASLFYTFLFFGISTTAFAQTTYYSQGSVDPTITANWNSNPVGGGTSPSNFTSGDIFIIQSPDSMTTNSPWVVSGVGSAIQIDNGGALAITSNVATELLTLNSGGKLYVFATLQVNNGNGGGYDLTLNGTANFNGTLIYSGGATGEVQTSGAFIYQTDGGTIPSFTWTGNASITVTGIITATTLGGLNQGFREFRWNSTSQISNVEFNSQLTSVSKNLLIQSTGSGSIVLFNSSANLDATYMDVNGGTVDFSTTSSVFPTITISSSGTSFSQLVGSTIQTSGSGSKGTFVFMNGDRDIRQQGTIGAGVGYHFLPGAVVGIINNQITVTGDMTIDSAAFFGYNYISNPTNYQIFTVVGTGGNFELKKYGTFYVYHDSGLTSSGANGSVQVTGSRVYDPLANYYFWGGTQVTGIATPDTINGNVEVWPGTSLTLSKNTLINGNLTIIDVPVNVGSYTLDLRGDIIDSLNSVVKGYFQSNSNGTILYNKTTAGQKVITNNSQYGNLTFNNYSKDLVSGRLFISNVFTRGASSVHNVFSNDSIEYNGTGAQTIYGFPYANLFITGSRGAGNVTFAAAETIFVANVFSPSVSFSGGSYVTSNSFIDFNGSTAQSISALSGGTPYHHLIVDKSAGVLTAGSAFTLTGNLHLMNGAFADGGNVITVNGNIGGSAGQHTSTGGGKILLTGGAGTHQISDVDLGTLEIDDANGTQVIAAPGIQNLILTSGVFDITNGLYVLNAGTISRSSGSVAGNGTVYFNGSATVSGIISFYDIELSGAVDFGTGSTITNRLLIKSSGSVTGNAPTYVGSALLNYATGGTFARGIEWSSFGGAGYPKNVQISNNTTLNLGFGGTGTARQLSGNLTIDSGSTLSMNVGGSQMTAPLNVLGYVINNGTLELSSSSGGYIDVKGDFEQNGTLTPHLSAVRMSGATTQIIRKSGGGYIYFDSLVIASTDSVILRFANSTNISIDSTLLIQSGVFYPEGTAIDFGNGADFIRTGGSIVPNNHVINFQGAGTVSGLVTLWNVNLSGNVDFGSGVSINNELKIQTGGSVATNPPAYNAGSTLLYFSGGSFNRNAEWSTSSGPGYPHHVIVSNNTALYLDAILNPNIPAHLGGNLSIETGAAMSMDSVGMTAPLTVEGNLTINGTLTASSVSGGSVIAKGDWTLNGTFIPNSQSVTFNGLSIQNLTGATTFDSIIINNSSNLNLFNSIDVASFLDFQNGNIVTNGNSVTLDSTATFSISSGYINGNLVQTIPTGSNVTRTLPIGDASYYTPVQVTFANVSAPGNITASTSVAGAELTGSFIDALKNVNRYWTLANSGVGYDTYNATFNFNAADVDGGANTNNFVIKRYEISSWNDVTTGTLSSTSSQGTGINGFGEFAVGELVTYDITSSVVGSGSITPFGTTSVSYGTNQNYSISADPGYHIDSVIVDGANIGVVASYDFLTVTSTHSIAAYFSINTYTFTTNAFGNGSVTPISPTVNYGNYLALTITSDPGYHVDSVLVDGILTDSLSSYTFDYVTASHTVDAYFSINNYTITTTVFGNGSISPVSPSVPHGSVQNITFSPDPGYQLDSVLVNGILIDSTVSYTFPNVTSAQSISAYFSVETVPPSSPQNLVAIAADGQIQIHWNPNSETDFQKYFVYRDTVVNPTIKVDSTTTIDDTLKTYTGLINGRTYYFRMAAQDTNGNVSGFSNEVASTPVGLIAYYPFSGNANDASGNGYHAVVNGAVLSLDRFGNANSSYNLNGSTDYLAVTNIDLPQGNTERTISAFFK